MKTIKKLCIALILLAIMGSLFAAEIPSPKEKLEIDGKMILSFSNLTKNKKEIILNGLKYTTKDAALVFFTVTSKAKNISKEEFNRISAIAEVELLCMDSDSKFSIYQVYNAPVAGIHNKPLKPGKTLKEHSFYQYPKKETPVALITERKNAIILINKSDERYPLVENIIRKMAGIEVMMEIAGTATFEEVVAHAAEYEISLFETDKMDYSLLAYAVNYNNIPLVDGLLSAGADPNRVIGKKNFTHTSAIILAVKNKNQEMIRTLVEAGADLTASPPYAISAAAEAITSKSSELLPLLKELGVDFATLTIPVKNRSPMPVREYAEQKKLTEVLAFLDTL